MMFTVVFFSLMMMLLSGFIHLFVLIVPYEFYDDVLWKCDWFHMDFIDAEDCCGQYGHLIVFSPAYRQGLAFSLSVSSSLSFVSILSFSV